MRYGMTVVRPTGVEFIEIPQHIGYWGEPCSHCGLTNTTYEVYPRTIETNCMTCARPQTTRLPDWVFEYVKEKFR